MGRINLLGKHIAGLVTISEVTERPASVIKEPIEDSINVDVTSISVEIQGGDALLMRVTGNGSNIAWEDVPTAFLCHVTSKVLYAEDLESTDTLGLHGEALASVAAVTRIDLLTRIEEELAGTHCAVEGDEEQALESAGCARGTIITVHDIFLNTSVRMKFLREDTVEVNVVAAMMDRIALSHPGFAVRSVRNGKETLRAPGDGQLKFVVFVVFDRGFTAGLTPVGYELQGMQVTGFMNKPSHARLNRSMQRLFINGRAIRSRTMQVALERTLEGSLMAGRFPVCMLHLKTPVQAVDVNVHSGKFGIHSINKRPVFNAVYYEVKTMLSKGDSSDRIALPDMAEPSAAKPQTLSLPFGIPNIGPQQIATSGVFDVVRPAVLVLNGSAADSPAEIAMPITPTCHKVGSPESTHPLTE